MLRGQRQGFGEGGEDTVSKEMEIQGFNTAAAVMQWARYHDNIQGFGLKEGGMDYYV